MITFLFIFRKKITDFFTSSGQTVQNIKLKYELVKWMIKEGFMMKTNHNVCFLKGPSSPYYGSVGLKILRSYLSFFERSKI